MSWRFSGWSSSASTRTRRIWERSATAGWWSWPIRIRTDRTSRVCWSTLSTTAGRDCWNDASWSSLSRRSSKWRRGTRRRPFTVCRSMRSGRRARRTGRVGAWNTSRVWVLALPRRPRNTFRYILDREEFDFRWGRFIWQYQITSWLLLIKCCPLILFINRFLVCDDFLSLRGHRSIDWLIHWKSGKENSKIFLLFVPCFRLIDWLFL